MSICNLLDNRDMVGTPTDEKNYNKKYRFFYTQEEEIHQFRKEFTRDLK
jgi:hypothetical protein